MVADEVEVFIDGYNFYYGLKEAGLGNRRWLDYVALAKRLNTTRKVLRVNYYTARVTRDPDAAERQSTYIDALTANARRNHEDTALHIVEGRLQWEPKTCRVCSGSFELPVEKHTDVNLATDMLVGAFEQRYHVAMLISGDADQVAAVRATEALGRTVRVVFPPERDSSHLKRAASTAYPLDLRFLDQCQLPKYVDGPDGVLLTRPPAWT